MLLHSCDITRGDRMRANVQGVWLLGKENRNGIALTLSPGPVLGSRWVPRSPPLTCLMGTGLPRPTARAPSPRSPQALGHVASARSAPGQTGFGDSGPMAADVTAIEEKACSGPRKQLKVVTSGYKQGRARAQGSPGLGAKGHFLSRQP